VFGAHVVAYNVRTGQMVGTFTLNPEGDFAIAGLEPGPFVVRAEPLDDGDLESFFNNGTNVELGFQVTYSERLAIVPAGGDAPGINISVRPK
jgi:hypothetical protein